MIFERKTRADANKLQACQFIPLGPASEPLTRDSIHLELRCSIVVPHRNATQDVQLAS